MPAYLIPIQIPKCSKCRKTASVTVYTAQSQLVGSFCGQCGAAEVRALNKPPARKRAKRADIPPVTAEPEPEPSKGEQVIQVLKDSARRYKFIQEKS